MTEGTATHTYSHTLTLKKILKADRETVFAAISTPEGLLSWFKPKEGVYATAAAMEAKPGGVWRIDMTNPDNEAFFVSGEIRDYTPPERLSYTWQWTNTQMSGMPPTLVTFVLSEHPDGTELVLTHEGFPEEQPRDMHIHGWTGCLNTLERNFNG